MEAKINDFINIIKDNSLTAKAYEVPESVKDSKYFEKSFLKEDYLVATKTLREEELSWFIAFELSQDNLTRYELNGHWDSSNLEDFIEYGFEEFKEALAISGSLNNKELKRQYVSEIKASKKQLKELLFENEKNNIPEIDLLFKRKMDWCLVVINFLVSYVSVVNPSPAAKQKTAKPPRLGKDEGLTVFNQNQIVILFHYLKHAKIIGKNTSKTYYAKLISGLTGYNDEKIRQAFSHVEINSKSVESSGFKKTEYEDVATELTRLANQIKSDAEKYFS